jgi:hypothetical protein
LDIRRHRMKEIARKIYRLPYETLTRFQKEMGYVSGTVLWTTTVIALAFTLVLAVNFVALLLTNQ